MKKQLLTISDYSEALEQLISKVFKFGSVVYAPLSIVWEQYMKQKDGHIKLPFISFFHTSDIELDLESTSMPDYKFGMLPFRDEDDNLYKDQTVKATLTYNFEIVATKRETVEAIFTELIFWFLNNQQYTIEKDGNRYDFTFLVMPNAQDNSNYDNYKEEGMLYRFTLPIESEIQLFRSKRYNELEQSVISIEKEDNDGNS